MLASGNHAEAQAEIIGGIRQGSLRGIGRVERCRWTGVVGVVGKQFNQSSLDSMPLHPLTAESVACGVITPNLQTHTTFFILLRGSYNCG